MGPEKIVIWYGTKPISNYSDTNKSNAHVWISLNQDASMRGLNALNNLTSMQYLKICLKNHFKSYHSSVYCTYYSSHGNDDIMTHATD